MISYLLPSRNRPAELAATLEALGALPAAAHERAGGAEVVVADNASCPPVTSPRTLANGLPVRVVRLETNRAAAARNDAARKARGRWLVMLDDDSHPLDAAFVDVLATAEPDVAAVGAGIVLPDGRREAGGLPEVFVGCGAAVRREAFLAAGGYDPAFEYYAEEYDLCARLIRGGHRIVHDVRFRVLHRKVRAGRDMDAILRRLVRNNAWIAVRYAPRPAEHLAEAITRYGAIARREGAQAGYSRGLGELAGTLDRQPRRPLQAAEFDRFTGLAHAREALARRLDGTAAAAVVDKGKNAWVVRRVLAEIGVETVPPTRAEALVIGTLSPGPMLDAWERRSAEGRPVLLSWLPRGGKEAGPLQCANGATNRRRRTAAPMRHGRP